MYKKFDEAAILSTSTIRSGSSWKGVMDPSSISTGITYDNILSLEDLLTDGDFDINAFISTKKNRSTLRNVKKIENEPLSLKLSMTEETTHWTDILWQT